MGADGGTIPKRCELVKKKKKREKVDKNVVNAARWRLCRLSQQPLKRPVVACKLGNLYNKEEVINAILSKKINECEVARHIKGLKDVKELRLTDNKEYKDDGADKGDIYKDHNVAPFCCPVTGIPMNGNHSFTMNWCCGCVISKKAIEEVKSDACHGCGGSFKKDDLILLNPPDDVLKIYEARLKEERNRKKFNKKTEEEMPITSGKIVEKNSLYEKRTLKDEKLTKAPVTGNDLLKRGEKRKVKAIETVSIQNSDASLAYKSLFTTCEEAKRKPEPHWITHNPLFY